MMGMGERIGLVILLGALLLAAGIQDARTREIANRICIAIALLAPLWWWANGIAPWPGMAIQVALAIGAFLLFAQAFRFGMMGGGDVKLIAALALWLPLDRFLSMLVVMSLAGGAVTLAMLIEHRIKGGGDRRGIEVPYGVAIAIAGLIAIREPILNQLS